MEDEKGEPAEAYSVASGLDYPSVGPEHAYLKDIGRVNYVTVTDEEALDAFRRLSVTEGIIPALESSHAVAYALKLAKELGRDASIVVNLSGRGDKHDDFGLVNYWLWKGETRIYVAIHCRACVFLGSRTFEYAPRRKAAPFASCLYLRVLTVTFIGLFGQNAYTANTGQGALSLAGAGGARERILP